MTGLCRRSVVEGPGYVNSTSIFLESGTSFVILKLRIWPAASDSETADDAGTLPFQRAFNIDESCERSGWPTADSGAVDF